MYSIHDRSRVRHYALTLKAIFVTVCMRCGLLMNKTVWHRRETVCNYLCTQNYIVLPYILRITFATLRPTELYLLPF